VLECQGPQSRFDSPPGRRALRMLSKLQSSGCDSQKRWSVPHWHLVGRLSRLCVACPASAKTAPVTVAGRPDTCAITLRLGHELGFAVAVQDSHLDAVFGAHAGRRRQRPVPDGEAVRQPRHEQVRVAGAQLDRAEEAVFRHSEQVLKVRLLRHMSHIHVSACAAIQRPTTRVAAETGVLMAIICHANHTQPKPGRRASCRVSTRQHSEPWSPV